ncbi:MAG: DUF5348 domain-containing protein [Oscillospiraceae bacterium]|nr:DUF5348 domain-containing protein [Oscillospiraceae bacterium]
MKKGILIYNTRAQRMDIRFDDGDTYGGLHCGETMDVNVNDTWVNTRAEYSHTRGEWYLVGVKREPVGLAVRI